MQKFKGFILIAIVCGIYFFIATQVFEFHFARNMSVSLFVVSIVIQLILQKPIYTFWNEIPKPQWILLILLPATSQINEVFHGYEKIFGFLFAFIVFFGFFSILCQVKPKSKEA